MESSEALLCEGGRYHPDGNYDVRFIKRVIEEINGGLPFKGALIKYGLKAGTLRHWLRSSADYKRKRVGAVAPGVKRSTARAVISGRMTIGEAMEACGIKAATTIRQWIAWEQQQKGELSELIEEEMAKKPTKSKDLSTNELKAVQQQLADAQLKIAALNTLIDVAEEQFKISIRKKPGAKQS